MKWLAALLACAALALAAPAFAQSNNDDYTPLNSRIKRDRQFPTNLPPNIVPPEKLSKVTKDWSRAMLSQFGRCLYHRSKAGALDLLEKTDYGFVNFDQIGMEMAKAFKIYGIDDCLGRVATTNTSSVQLQYTAAGIRQWLIQAAYSEAYSKGPSWVKPGYIIAPRKYPLSANYSGVRASMDLADCVVAAAPYDADYYYRTASGSDEAKDALKGLVPSLGPCLPQGQQMQIDPNALRVWLGEALWHAANNSEPAPVEAVGQEAAE